MLFRSTVIIALIVRQIRHGVDGPDRIAADLINGPVDGCDTADIAAVVLDSFNGAVGCIAGSDRCHQDQHVLAADHRHDVLAEDDLGVSVILRLNDINRLMLIQGAEAGLGQLLGDAGVLDVILLNRNLLGMADLTKEGKANADVDLDGKPTPADSLNIMKYLVKLIEKLPVTE